MFARKVHKPAPPAQLPPVTPPPDPDPDPDPDPQPPPEGFGPNAFAGAETPFPIFEGDELPAKATTYGGLVLNDYGMGSTYSHARNWSIVEDEDSASGYALQMDFWGSGHPKACAQWPPPDAGGGAAVRGYLRGGIDAQNWRKLHVYIAYKFSPNFSTQARYQALTTHHAGTVAAGTTTTRVYFQGSPGWTTNQWVDKTVRGTSGFGAVIIASGTDYVDVAADDRFDLTPGTGTAMNIISYAPADTHPSGGPLLRASAGCKGLFWPRQRARMVGNQGAPGGGAGYGESWSKDVVGRWGENHYQACWDGQGVNANPPGGVTDSFGLQLDKRWDPPYLVDANGLPIWSGTRFTQYPPKSGIELPYTRGTVKHAEIFLQLNTPGQADGIYRVWHDLNPTPVRNHTNVLYTERYVSSQAVQGQGVTNMPVLGGSARDVAYEVIENYWNFLWIDTTFGGIPAMYVPAETHQWFRYLHVAVCGAP